MFYCASVTPCIRRAAEIKIWGLRILWFVRGGETGAKFTMRQFSSMCIGHILIFRVTEFVLSAIKIGV